MSLEYKLYRNSGYLFFNSFSDKERYWVSILAAANGGGAMYANITQQEFNEVFEETREIDSFSTFLIDLGTQRKKNILKINIKLMKQYKFII